MTTKYGVFSEPPRLGVGDPYTQKSLRSERDTGLNFKATVGREGKTNDATFDKFKPLYEKERFIDPIRTTLQASAASRKHCIVDRPFKGPNPMKKSTGLGDFYGTVGGKVEYITPLVETKKLKGQIPSQPPGMYTNPPKKGSYGTNKTTLSERAGAMGTVEEYMWLAEPYSLAQEKVRVERVADRAARVTELPFKPSSPGPRGTHGVPGVTLARKGKGIIGEYEYIGEGPSTAIKQPKVDTPFKPSSPNKSGFQGTINRFPEYFADPEQPKREAEASAKLAESARLGALHPWRPSHTPKTDAVRSIMRANI